MHLPGRIFRRRAGIPIRAATQVLVLLLIAQAPSSGILPDAAVLHDAAPPKQTSKPTSEQQFQFSQKQHGGAIVREAAATERMRPRKGESEAWQKKREALLQSTVTLRLGEDIPGRDDRLPHDPFRIPIADHPDWVIARSDRLGARATLDEEKVATFIEREIIPRIPGAEHLTITASASGTSFTNDRAGGRKNPRAAVEGDIQNGWQLSSASAAEHVVRAIEAGLLSITLPLEETQGRIVNETGDDLGEFTLLSTGRSNFTGSVPNRVYNIKKALREHLNGILIPPGGTFSFNNSLDGPVEVRTGWKTALGIFNRDELQPTAGGGICQVSTTVYRALVQLGLPITQRRNHSMYIKYYRQYGEGLDATVYIGSQDLVAVNDTPGHLFIRAYEEGEDAVVEIYGTPDGRTVALEGPYRRHDAPEEVRNPERKRALGRNDIAWKQTITRRDGTADENIIISRYQTDIPEEPAGAWTIVNGQWEERTAATENGEEENITI